MSDFPSDAPRNTFGADTDEDVTDWGEENVQESERRVTELLRDIVAELIRARDKFPGKNVTFCALIEEVGELSTALFSEPRANVRKEAVQVAVMAMRIVLDGDHTLEAWRYSRDLDELVPRLDAQREEPAP